MFRQDRLRGKNTKIVLSYSEDTILLSVTYFFHYSISTFHTRNNNNIISLGLIFTHAPAIECGFEQR